MIKYEGNFYSRTHNIMCTYRRKKLCEYNIFGILSQKKYFTKSRDAVRCVASD